MHIQATPREWDHAIPEIRQHHPHINPELVYHALNALNTDDLTDTLYICLHLKQTDRLDDVLHFDHQFTPRTIANHDVASLLHAAGVRTPVEYTAKCLALIPKLYLAEHNTTLLRRIVDLASVLLYCAPSARVFATRIQIGPTLYAVTDTVCYGLVYDHFQPSPFHRPSLSPRSYHD